MLKRMLTKWNMWQDVLNAVMKLKLLKLQGISWAAEELLACREGLGSVGLVNHMVRYIVQCTIEIVLLDCSSYIWISISVIFRNEKSYQAQQLCHRVYFNTKAGHMIILLIVKHAARYVNIKQTFNRQ